MLHLFVGMVQKHYICSYFNRGELQVLRGKCMSGDCRLTGISDKQEQC